MKRNITIASLLIVLSGLIYFITFYNPDPINAHFEEWDIIRDKDDEILSFKEPTSFTKGGLHYAVFEKTSASEKVFNEYILKHDVEEYPEEKLKELLESLSADDGVLLNRINGQDIEASFILQEDSFNKLILVKTREAVIYIFVQI